MMSGPRKKLEQYVKRTEYINIARVYHRVASACSFGRLACCGQPPYYKPGHTGCYRLLGAQTRVYWARELFVLCAPNGDSHFDRLMRVVRVWLNQSVAASVYSARCSMNCMIIVCRSRLLLLTRAITKNPKAKLSRSRLDFHRRVGIQLVARDDGICHALLRFIVAAVLWSYATQYIFLLPIWCHCRKIKWKFTNVLLWRTRSQYSIQSQSISAIYLDTHHFESIVVHQAT